MTTGQDNTNTDQLMAAPAPVTPPQFDVETAVLMRCALRPAFERAASWGALMDAMRHQGYRMGFRGGRLCLMRRGDGQRVCGLQFLGFELRDLVERLGRPVVVARPGGHADGDFLRHAPDRALLH